MFLFYFNFSFRITQAKYANKKIASNSSNCVNSVRCVFCHFKMFTNCSKYCFQVMYVPVSSLDFNPYTTLYHHISCTYFFKFFLCSYCWLIMAVCGWKLGNSVRYVPNITDSQYGFTVLIEVMLNRFFTHYDAV